MKACSSVTPNMRDPLSRNSSLLGTPTGCATSSVFQQSVLGPLCGPCLGPRSASHIWSPRTDSALCGGFQWTSGSRPAADQGRPSGGLNSSIPWSPAPRAHTVRVSGPTRERQLWSLCVSEGSPGLRVGACAQCMKHSVGCTSALLWRHFRRTVSSDVALGPGARC